MIRISGVAFILLCLSSSVWAQAQSAPTGAPNQAATPAKPAVKKPGPKAKTAVRQPVVADGGPCRLGVISVIGDRFAVEKFGLTVFENEQDDVPIEDWGLDDLAFARVRAATGADPRVRKIAYPKGAFEPFYHPKSRFLPDTREGLPAIVRSVTPNANCERYLVMTTFKGELPGTRLMLDGIGAYNQGLGSLIRHSHLFANIAVNVLDGRTYEKLNRPFVGVGARLSEGLRITEDPLTRLDNSLFPEPAAAASSSATLRERTRVLVAARLDQTLPDYLKEE
jgi:hypothetical protein